MASPAPYVPKKGHRSAEPQGKRGKHPNQYNKAPVVAVPPVSPSSGGTMAETAPTTPKNSSTSRVVGAGQSQAVSNVRRWRSAPWLYVREVFQAEPDDWQDAVLHQLVEDPGGVKIALKACKGPGKSCLLAWIMWWFLTCFTHPKILATSITGENLKDGLWAELAKWRNKSPMLTNLFEWQSDRIFAKAHKETWFASARTWPKDADKTKQANTLAGQHAQHTMMVVDEAGDVPEGVVAAGLAHHSTDDPTVQEVHISLMAGNPTSLDGALGVACTRDRAKWQVTEITGDPDDPMRAKRIDVKWAREEIEKWGKDSDWARINVFGQFPRTQGNKLLGPDQVKKAMEATFAEASFIRSPRIMGLDVARSLAADKSALCRRQGNTVFPFRTYRIDDLMELVNRVAWEASQWLPTIIFVDVGGLGGGVVDRLRELGLPVVGVNFGMAARDNRFADKRSEMWWDMHIAIKGTGGIPQVALPSESELIAELTAPSIKFNDRSKMKLESKESMKARGISSPDLADALALTYAEPVFGDYALAPFVEAELHKSQHTDWDFDPYRNEE